MELVIKKIKPKPSVVLDTYWQFAAERQKVFFNRFYGNTPLTDNPILLKHKFTNVYRASDRVSQYLIRNVIYNGHKYTANDTLLRILLFKIFNKIQTWELIENELGNVCIETFNTGRVAALLSEAVQSKETIFSGAYIMPSGKSTFGAVYKHINYLRWLEKHVVYGNLAERIQSTPDFEALYTLLLNLPMIGSFLAYQYAIDINYSELTNFSESDFTVAGPGAKDGIRKCFINYGDYSNADIIRYVTEHQNEEFGRLALHFNNLWGRELQLIDCQNLFCEISKYARVAHPDVEGVSGRKRIKQLYRAQTASISYFYPPKWGLLVPEVFSAS